MKAKKARNLTIKTEVSGAAKTIKDRLLNLREEAKKKGLIKDQISTPGKAKPENTKNKGGQN